MPLEPQQRQGDGSDLPVLPGGRSSHTVRDSLSPCTGSVCVLRGCRWQGAQAIQRGGGAEWQQQRVKGSTPRRQLRPARVSVQIIVYSGKGAGAQPHASHEPQTLRGLAQGQHQRGLLWQVLRFQNSTIESSTHRFPLDWVQLLADRAVPRV